MVPAAPTGCPSPTAPPGLTSEPFQEKMIVLQGQRREHVFDVLSKLRGEGAPPSAGLGMWPCAQNLKFVPGAAGSTEQSLLPCLLREGPQTGILV